MAIISDLKISISQLEPEAQLSLIRELRALRRIPKDKPVKKSSTKNSTKTKKPKQLSLDQLIDGMSADQVAALVANLKKKGKG